MAATTERIYTEADVRAWRDGDWIIVSLDGEVIYRRLTRDRAFTRVEVIFAENQSPLLPKTRRYLRGVDLAGPPVRARRRWRAEGNRLTAPIWLTAPISTGGPR